MKVLIGVLFVALAAMAALLRSQSEDIRVLETEIQTLKAKAVEESKAANLDLQAKCAAQAQHIFGYHGYEKRSTAVYENHYSAKVNKCFIHIRNTTAGKDGAWIFQKVLDAFEAKELGTYTLWSDATQAKGQASGEIKPIQCHVVLPSGKEKNCQSGVEFEELIKVYLEGH